MIGYTVLATDGRIGHVDEFYFDDRQWIIRYLVVNTGNWLTGRRVLISPLVLDRPDWASQMLPVSLTREQVEHSPDIDLVKPVSRQYEVELREYYGWPIYWAGLSTPISPASTGVLPEGEAVSTGEKTAGLSERPESWAGLTVLVTPKATEAEAKPPPGETGPTDSHLRSTDEVLGYHIQARDGEIGHVEDFIVNDEDWPIQFMIVDTRNWLPGKKVLVSPQWIERVEWADAKVHVDLSQEVIRQSLEYDPAQPVNQDLAERVFDYITWFCRND